MRPMRVPRVKGGFDDDNESRSQGPQ